MSEPSSQDWYCAHSKPRKERYALEQLERQGFECYLPFLRRRQMRRDKSRWITAPMFPRYLFLRTPDPGQLGVVRSTLGVSNLVVFGQEPGRVPDAVIEQIRNQCADDVFVQEEPAFRPGERVHIVDGPCRGLQAIFQRVTSSTERVMILLEIMENVAQVEIARSQIVTAES